MPSLVITAAQPNPRGRDTVSPGRATNEQLNREWIQFEAQIRVDLNGVSLRHVTFDLYCRQTGSEVVTTFTGTLDAGQSVRLHTGGGQDGWSGNLFHIYLGRSWYIWNNACGDRATLLRAAKIIDSAAYRPDPPEGELRRVPGTDRLE